MPSTDHTQSDGLGRLSLLCAPLAVQLTAGTEQTSHCEQPRTATCLPKPQISAYTDDLAAHLLATLEVPESCPREQAVHCYRLWVSPPVDNLEIYGLGPERLLGKHDLRPLFSNSSSTKPPGTV